MKKTSIGGQALLEGIMMRGPKITAMAVRNPQGEIVLEEAPTRGQMRPKICRLPENRGIFGMIDSLVGGYKYLMRSAEICGADAEEEEKARAKREKKNQERAKKGLPPIEGTPLSEKLFNAILMPLATVLARWRLCCFSGCRRSCGNGCSQFCRAELRTTISCALCLRAC